MTAWFAHPVVPVADVVACSAFTLRTRFHQPLALQRGRESARRTGGTAGLLAHSGGHMAREGRQGLILISLNVESLNDKLATREAAVAALDMLRAERVEAAPGKIAKDEV
jgi:hypothetical protein